MRSWSSPDVPRLPVTGPVVRVHDTASNQVVETRQVLDMVSVISGDLPPARTARGLA